MKLTTVLCAVNDNPAYYMFIPKQIIFWNKFNINFIAVYVGNSLPDELKPFKNNIILWNNTPNLNSAYVAQNIRIYYPALLDLPDDEMVMITDMDMLPMNDKYYKDGLENYTIDDFIYYRNIDGNQIYMCYNAAHPKLWSKIFGISSIQDIENILIKNYNTLYNGIPGSTGWFTDQEILYKYLINYPNLKILNKPIKRIEMSHYNNYLRIKRNFISEFDDAHYHRNYFTNLSFILDSERQLFEKIN